MPYVETYQEFKKRMDCPFVKTRSGQIYFQNGAQANEFDGRMMWQEPPAEKWPKLALQLEYYKEVRRLAEVRLRNAKQAAINQLTNIQNYNNTSLPMPTEQDLEGLKKLREKLEDAENDVMVIEEKIAQSPANMMRRQRQEREQAIKDRAGQMMELIRDI